MQMKEQWSKSLVLLFIALALSVAGCRRDDDSEEPQTSTVGSAKCMQCHYNYPSNGYVAGDATDSSPDSPTYFDALAGGAIGANYQSSVHYSPSFSPNSTDYVTCEGCHGPGGRHNGVGPIPYYNPGIDQCGGCHTPEHGFDVTAFKATSHANANNTPDAYFFQGGVGNDQATYQGQPEYKSNGTTPVTKNEHIQECAACHTPGTKSPHIAANDLGTPQVICASCHDPHQPVGRNRNDVPTRVTTLGAVDPVFVLNFKPQKVNNDDALPQFGAKNLTSGTWIRPRLHFDYHVNGDVSQTFYYYNHQHDVTDDILRLTPERLCASCHTKGKYLHGAFAGTTPITETHQEDIYSQYLKSGHGDKHALPFEEFSLLAPALDHRPKYPTDMAYSANGQHNFNGGANNYACNQCHHGIGSIDYQKAVQGGLDPAIGNGDSDKAHVLWGDSTVTCITCHEPHKNGNTTTANVRVPVYLSYNSAFTPTASPDATGNKRGGVNRMMDLTAIPTGAGNSVICLFCHQGRESGWTVWNKIRRSRVAQGDTAQNAIDFAYNNPTQRIDPRTSGSNRFSFTNDHYLSGGALLWSKNYWEFAGKRYANGISNHQQRNCTGCHMADASPDNSEGGHTWKARLVTCQTAGCHPSATSFEDIEAEGDYDGDTARETAAEEIGTISLIPTTEAVNRPVYGSGKGGTGLLGRLNEALFDVSDASGDGIRYDPDAYPYFYKHSATTQYNATMWTTNTHAAAFNLGALYKTGAALHVHNVRYAAQLLIDSLNALGKTGHTVTFERPDDDRDATDYRNQWPVPARESER